MSLDPSSYSTYRNGAFVFPTVSDVLRSAQHVTLSPLVDDETQARLVSLTRDFAVPVQTVCYECRLAEHDSRVDLALCMLPPFAEHERFRSAVDDLGAKRTAPEWSRPLNFLRNWADMVPGYRPEFPLLWLAFDLDANMGELPVPCPAPCVDPHFFARRLGLNSEPPSAGKLARLAATCHDAFFGRPLSEEARRLVLRCLSVHGVAVRAQHFSFMVPRNPATFKLDVQLPVDHVASYLTAIAWPGPARAIEARIRHYMPWHGNVQLNLVLSPRLSPPLEVEFLSGGQTLSPAERFGFLSRMVDTSLCSPAKAEVLRRTWERRLLSASGACESAVALNWYVKIRFEEDFATEAKAYVGLMPRLWRTRSQITTAALAAC